MILSFFGNTTYGNIAISYEITKEKVGKSVSEN